METSFVHRIEWKHTPLTAHSIKLTHLNQTYTLYSCLHLDTVKS